jgi:membrane protein
VGPKSPRLPGSRLLAFLKEAFIVRTALALRRFVSHDALSMSAAVAFYAILSIGPLLVLVLAIADTLWGREAAFQVVLSDLQKHLGESTAATIESAVRNSRIPGEIGIATGIAAGLLLFGSTLLFAQIRESLAVIWKLETPGGFLREYLKQRLLALLAIFAVGILLLVSFVSSSAFTLMRDWFAHFLHPTVRFALDWSISWVWFTLLIAALFQVLTLSSSRIWRRSWLGAATSAFLFLTGKELIALYLSKATVASVYGTAGSLATLALWVYYSTMALFFGAEYAQAWEEPEDGD